MQVCIRKLGTDCLEYMVLLQVGVRKLGTEKLEYVILT